MAAKKTTKVKKAEWKGYHRVNLDTVQNALFEAQYMGKGVQISDLDILVNNGYKVSFGWDDYNSGASASLYAQNAKMEWAGFTLSCWAGDVQTALELLLFKHYVVCQEVWEIAKPEREGASTKWG